MKSMKPTSPEIDVQIACADYQGPDPAQLVQWTEQALAAAGMRRGDIAIRIVDADESRTLNLEYRGKDKATNVLSFPFDMPEGLPQDLPPVLGDLVICAPVVAAEATEQGKTEQAHWAHMIVHGVLHLLGHDHIDDAEADIMESLETDILAGFGFADPYNETGPGAP